MLGGGGRVDNRKGWGFLGPKDKSDTDAQPYITMLFMIQGLHELNFRMDAMNNSQKIISGDTLPLFAEVEAGRRERGSC
jgi:hypothetical protein